LQRLLVLLPCLQGRILSLKPQLVADLVKDADALAARLIQLREWLPKADLQAVLGSR